jgi:hypothetical protein
MKKFAFFLALFPFLLNYSNSNTFTNKVKVTDNSCKVNFSSATTKLTFSYIMPDTTSDSTSTSKDTLIKS